MAPGRKKGTNRSKVGELRLGDLVLAKVKGFPFWPAKISNPENWDKSPDPRKYFVQFFGTEEIAFVAPADIQVLTNDSKSKLEAKCQGKTKYFARAVEEICEAFEGLQHKEETVDDTQKIADNPGSFPVPHTTSSKHDKNHDDWHSDNQDEKLQDKTAGKSKFRDEIHGLERCSKSRDRPFTPIENSKNAGGINSSISSIAKSKEKPNNGVIIQKEGKRAALLCSSSVKEENNVAVHRSPMYKHQASEAETPLAKGSDAGRNQDRSDSGDVCSDRVSNATSSVSTCSKTATTAMEEDDHKALEAAPKRNRKMDNSSKLQKSCILAQPLNKSPDNGSACLSYKTQREDVENNRQDGNSPKDPKKHSSGKDMVLRGRGKVQLDSMKGQDPESSLSHEDSSKKKPELGNRKHKIDGNDDSHVVKKLKTKEQDSDAPRKMQKDDCTQLPKSKRDKDASSKKVKGPTKFHDHLTSRTEKLEDASNLQGDGSHLSKRRRQAPDTVSSKITAPGATDSAKVRSTSTKDGTAGHGRLPTAPIRSRRRSFLLDDDEDEDEHRTPIHKKSSELLLKDDVNRNFDPESCSENISKLKDSSVENLTSRKDDESCNEKALMPEVAKYLPSDGLGKIDERRLGITEGQRSSCSPQRTENAKLSSKDERPNIVSPKATAGVNVATKSAEYKSAKSQGKASTISAGKKVQPGPSKLSSQPTQDSSVTLSQSTIQNNGSSSTSEKSNSALKSVRVIENTEDRSEHDSQKHIPAGEQPGAFRDVRAQSYAVDSKLADSLSSMKHLIAAAQAKRKEAHLRTLPIDKSISFSVITPPLAHGRSPSPIAGFNTILSGNSVQKDLQGFHSSATFSYPANRAYQNSSTDRGVPEDYEHRTSPRNRPAGGSLSGGTEAAVARDALEGMIETLSRTKESIGRATRLAIDCAKYGIASEVVELLIRKLENEPSLHRRVDLFFLVDSITQCSHSQKGIAGASFIPTVQAELPRLLGAAAPPGSGARENRRQCLKVLRLWLERKILPESVLQQYMDDIDVPNNDVNAGFLLRRPSRAERSIDDPIREMEGMLVDEYGSNATFQLPGLFPSNVFHDDEDLPGTSCKDSGDDGAIEAGSTLEDPETSVLTPTDRRHFVLEDVDGELEMEDVSGSSKDDVWAIAANDGFEQDFCQHGGTESASSLSPRPEFPPLPPGTPPPPAHSPPPPPPLPTSPPPRPPSPLSSPPPPPPMLPPPPPPLPLLPSLSSSPSSLLCHQPLPQEYCRNSSASQPVQMTGNAPMQGHCNSDITNEMALQQSSHFLTPNPQSIPSYSTCRPFEYGHSDMYPTPQASIPSHQFEQGSGSFQQIPYNTLSSVQTPSNNFPPVKPVNENRQQRYDPYSVPNVHVQRPYNPEDHRRVHYSDFSPDNQHKSWVSGRRPSACAGVPFVQDGYFRLNIETPTSNSMGFQFPLHNSMSVGLLPQGAPCHGHPQMMTPHGAPNPNCWRPV